MKNHEIELENKYAGILISILNKYNISHLSKKLNNENLVITIFDKDIENIYNSLTNEMAIAEASTEFSMLDDILNVFIPIRYKLDGKDIHSDRIFEIKTEKEENLIKMYNFKRYSDDSGVCFKLIFRSSTLELKNFDFTADFNSFKNFIHDFKKLYNQLSGEAYIENVYENYIIKIIALARGDISVSCKIDNVPPFDGYISQSCQIVFFVDQTYLAEMAKEIDLIYEDLGLL